MRLIFYILILCLTVWAGVFLQKNTDNVELVYKDWIIEMPIWLPIIGSIALLFLVTVIFNVFASLRRGYRKIKDWLIGSSMRAMLQNAYDGDVALIEGDWHHAEAKMLKALKNSDLPLHYYLVAAEAAQGQGALDRRDNYLQQALRAVPGAKEAILLTQATLQFEQGQFEYCLSTIQELQKISTHKKQVLKLSANVFTATGAWDDMVSLLPQLRKYTVFADEDLTALEIKTYTYILRTKAKKANKSTLLSAWDDLPREVRNHIEIVEAYAQLLLNMQAYNEVELLLRNQLKRQWDSKLVKLYGLSLGSDINKQIAIAETWLKTHQDDAALLLTLARLCIMQKLWGKARNYLDASLSLEQTPDAYAELGRLLGFLGDQQKALECYKQGLLEFAAILPLEQVTNK